MHIDVVGGGIAGLYAAYKLKRRGLDVCVYEKSRRLGGRIETVRFAGRDVPTGAGIGRGKDALLRALCDELGVGVKEFTTQFKYRLPRGMEDVDIMRTVRVLRAHAGDRETFRQLGTRVLGKSTYRAFVVKSDARDMLYNYGFEDTVPGYTALGGPDRPPRQGARGQRKAGEPEKRRRARGHDRSDGHLRGAKGHREESPWSRGTAVRSIILPVRQGPRLRVHGVRRPVPEDPPDWCRTGSRLDGRTGSRLDGRTVGNGVHDILRQLDGA